MRRANYRYEVRADHVMIEDLGPWDQHPTVTNDAENVIEDLRRQGILGQRRVLYRDSEGRIDELVHQDGRFVGFKPGPV